MSPTQIKTNPYTISLKGSNHIISLDLEKVASKKLSNNNTSKNLKDSSKESNNLKKQPWQRLSLRNEFAHDLQKRVGKVIQPKFQGS